MQCKNTVRMISRLVASRVLEDQNISNVRSIAEKYNKTQIGSCHHYNVTIVNHGAEYSLPGKLQEAPNSKPFHKRENDWRLLT